MCHRTTRLSTVCLKMLFWQGLLDGLHLRCIKAEWLVGRFHLLDLRLSSAFGTALLRRGRTGRSSCRALSFRRCSQVTLRDFISLLVFWRWPHSFKPETDSLLGCSLLQCLLLVSSLDSKFTSRTHDLLLLLDRVLVLYRRC